MKDIKSKFFDFLADKGCILTWQELTEIEHGDIDDFLECYYPEDWIREAFMWPDRDYFDWSEAHDDWLVCLSRPVIRKRRKCFKEKQ